MADRKASQPRAVCDRLVLNDKVTRTAQTPLYCYCRPADGIIDSKGPVTLMIALNIFAGVNKEVKLVAAGQKKRARFV